MNFGFNELARRSFYKTMFSMSLCGKLSEGN